MCRATPAAPILHSSSTGGTPRARKGALPLTLALGLGLGALTGCGQARQVPPDSVVLEQAPPAMDSTATPAPTGDFGGVTDSAARAAEDSIAAAAAGAAAADAAATMAPSGPPSRPPR